MDNMAPSKQNSTGNEKAHLLVGDIPRNHMASRRLQFERRKYNFCWFETIPPP